MKKTDKATQLNIRYASTDGKVLLIPVGERDLTIGSAETADIYLPSTTISRLHARIAFHDDRVYVTDLNSRNGTFINGKRIQSNVELEWLPGDHLRLSETSLELIQETVQQGSTQNGLTLTATPTLVKQGQIVHLALSAVGETQRVTLQSQAVAPGLGVQMNWQGGEVRPDTPIEIEAQIRSTKFSLMGGERRVRFVAISQSNLISTVEVRIQLRKRIETLLLLLLLLTGCGAASVLAIVVLPQIIRTPTAEQAVQKPDPSIPPPSTEVAIAPTLSPVIPSRVATTEAPTITDTPITPTPIVPTVCANGSTVNYTVQSGDTLYGIGIRYNTNVSSLMQNNGITDSSKISVGQRLTIHCGEYPPPVVITTEAPNVCVSVTQTSPDGLDCDSNTFYWDPIAGANHYQFNLYDEKGALINSLTTTDTHVTTDMSVQSAGSGLRFSWNVQAIGPNNNLMCSSATTNILRSPCWIDTPKKADLVVDEIVVNAACSEIRSLNINYTFRVTNNGPDDATSIVITENGITTITPVEANGVDTPSSNKDSINRLGAGESRTFTGSFAVPLSGRSFNYLTTISINAQSEVADDNMANNSASGTQRSAESMFCRPPVTDEPEPNIDVAVSLNDKISANCLQADPSKLEIHYTYRVSNRFAPLFGSVSVAVNRKLTLFVSNDADDLNGTPTSTVTEYPIVKTVTLGSAQQEETVNETLVVPSPLSSEAGESWSFGYRFDFDVKASIDDFVEKDTSNNSGTMGSKVNARTFNCRPFTEEPDPSPKTDVEVIASDNITANCLQTDPNQFEIHYSYTVINNGPLDVDSINVVVNRELTLLLSESATDLTGKPTTTNPIQYANKPIIITLTGDETQKTVDETLVVPSPIGINETIVRFGYQFKFDVTVSIDSFEDSDPTNNSRTMIGSQGARTFNCRPIRPTPTPTPDATSDPGFNEIGEVTDVPEKTDVPIGLTLVPRGPILVPQN